MIRFFNTYEPVTDFYRDLLPVLAERGLLSEVVISSAKYRPGRSDLAGVLSGHGVHVCRVPAGIGYASSRPRKLVVLLTYVLGATVRGLVGPQVNLNFFLTQPPLFALLGRVFRVLRGQRYCCLVMDLYPHVLAAGGRMSTRGFLYRLLRRVMRSTLQKAEVVFVIGRCMRDRLIVEGVDRERIVVVHNWAHEQRIHPVPRECNPLRAQFGLGDEFVILYSGNMGVAHRFDTILEAAQRLRNRCTIRFLFLGEGEGRRAIGEAVRSRGLSNVVIGNLQPDHLLLYSQSLGDVHYVCLRDEFSGLMVPSKAYSTLAAGRALLYEGADGDEVARIIRDNGLGICVPPGDVGAMVSAILRLADDRARTRAMSERARVAATSTYSRQAALASYAAAIGSLVPLRDVVPKQGFSD